MRMVSRSTDDRSLSSLYIARSWGSSSLFPGFSPIRSLTLVSKHLASFERSSIDGFRARPVSRSQTCAFEAPVMSATSCSDMPRSVRSSLSFAAIVVTWTRLYATDGAIGGVIRVTTSRPGNRDHVWSKARISFAGVDEHNLYSTNIQVAELNALNACLAVIKWKKICGFYHDIDKELFSLYTIDGNNLLNADNENESSS